MEIEFLSKTNLVGNIWELEFKKPNAFVYEAGDYVDLAVPNVDAKMLSMSSNPSEETLKFTIRIPKNPSPFKLGLSALTEGSVCFISPAIGNFNLPKVPVGKLIFVAYGIGITPYRSILLESNLPKISLLYSAKENEHIYQEEIADSQVDYKKLALRVTAKEVLAEITNSEGYLVYIAGPEKACVDLYTELLANKIERQKIILEYFTGY